VQTDGQDAQWDDSRYVCQAVLGYGADYCVNQQHELVEASAPTLASRATSPESQNRDTLPDGPGQKSRLTLASEKVSLPESRKPEPGAD
jgi:hypothetical protein